MPPKAAMTPARNGRSEREQGDSIAGSRRIGSRCAAGHKEDAILVLTCRFLGVLIRLCGVRSSR